MAYITSAASRSLSIASLTPGYWILTATSRPSGVTARWTWPIDAAATGMSPHSRNTRSGARPRSAFDHAGGERRRHRRGVGLQCGERLLRLVGQRLEDEADELARLHQHALHLAEFLGDVLGGADGELLVEFGPPFLGAAEAADLRHGEPGRVARRELPDACRAREAARERRRLGPLRGGGQPGGERHERRHRGDRGDALRCISGRRAAGRPANLVRRCLAPTHRSVGEVGAVGEPGEGGLDVAQVAFDQVEIDRCRQRRAPTVGAGRRRPGRLVAGDVRSARLEVASSVGTLLRRPGPNRVSADGRGAADDAALGRLPAGDGDARTVGGHPRRLRRLPARAGDVPRPATLRQLRRQLRVERARPVRRPVPQHRVPERTRGHDQVRPDHRCRSA